MKKIGILFITVFSLLASSQTGFAQFGFRLGEVGSFELTSDTSIQVQLTFGYDTLAAYRLAHYPNGVFDTLKVLNTSGATQSTSLGLNPTTRFGNITVWSPDTSNRTHYNYTLVDTAALSVAGGIRSRDRNLNIQLAAGQPFSKVLLVNSRQMPLDTGLPGGLLPIGKAFTISTSPQVSTFTGTNEASLQYFEGFLSSDQQEIMHLFRWDDSLQKWAMAVESPTIDTTNQVVSAPITQPGTYAFFSVTDIFSSFGALIPNEELEVKATRFIDIFLIIDSAATMVAEARDSVVLKSGFWAVEGSDFTAKITGYTPPSAARLASTNHDPLKEVLVESIPVVEEERPFTEESLSDKLLLFPNPFDGQLRVRYYLSTPGKTSIRLVDMAGKYQQVLLPATPQQIGMHEYAFKLEGLPQGTYLLQLTSEEGGKTLLNTQKIIKQ